MRINCSTEIHLHTEVLKNCLILSNPTLSWCVQDFDPLSVAPEWRMWAKGQLAAPPDPITIARSAARRAHTAKLAEELDAEELKRKQAIKAESPPIPLTWDPKRTPDVDS